MPDFSFVDSVIQRLAAEDAAKIGITDENRDNEACESEAKTVETRAIEDTNNAPTTEIKVCKNKTQKKVTASKGKSSKTEGKENAAKAVPATDKPKKKRGPNKKKAEPINSSTIIGPTPEQQVQSNSLNVDPKNETTVDSSAIFAATPVTHTDHKTKTDAVKNPVSDGVNNSVTSDHTIIEKINDTVETDKLANEKNADIEKDVRNTNKLDNPTVVEENANTVQNDTEMNVDNSEEYQEVVVNVNGENNNQIENVASPTKAVDPYEFPLSSEQESEIVTLNHKSTINNVKSNVGKSSIPKKSFECLKGNFFNNFNSNSESLLYSK